MSHPHLVQECSPEEARMLLKGYADVVCREADGSIAWEVHQPNIITDAGRRRFAELSWGSSYIITSPSVEPGDVARSALFDTGDPSAFQTSGVIAGTYDAFTLTRTWGTSFNTPPAQTRRIGTVGLSSAPNGGSGAHRLYAYTVLAPVKTQSPTQTLEVQYRVTLTPVY